MERPDQETKLFLRDGQPRLRGLHPRRPAPRARMLVRDGQASARTRWTRARCSKHARAAAHGPGPAGREAAHRGGAGVAPQGAGLRGHLRHLRLGATGVFTFCDGVPPPATAVTLEMDLQNLLMEGVRRIDERARLAEVFPDLDMAVEAMVNPERVKHSVTLTPEEWKVFFLRRRPAQPERDLPPGGQRGRARPRCRSCTTWCAAKFVIVVPAAAATPAAPSRRAGAASRRHDRGRHSAQAARRRSARVSVEFSDRHAPRQARGRHQGDRHPQGRRTTWRTRARSRSSRLVLVKDGRRDVVPARRATPTPWAATATTTS